VPFRTNKAAPGFDQDQLARRGVGGPAGKLVEPMNTRADYEANSATARSRGAPSRPSADLEQRHDVGHLPRRVRASESRHGSQKAATTRLS
jgi:hypothetical protein